VNIDRDETRWLLRLAGEVGISSAAALKEALVEALASAGRVELDLEQALEIDVTVLQLAWAAARQAELAGSSFVARPSEAARATARLAGFAAFPGEPPASGAVPPAAVRDAADPAGAQE